MLPYILLGLAGIIVLLLAIVIIRALCFNPKNEVKDDGTEVEFDKDSAINALAELVKCKTVSYYDASLEDNAEFEKLIDKLPALYPNVWKTCSLQRFEGRGLLFRWEGEDSSLEPAVLMAHYDVVPVNEKEWTMPAFDALIKDGIMWGRGTLDTKITFNGIMSGAENLIKQGFKPKSDIYFAFSGGEEVNGIGAEEIVKYFKENNITPSFVLDEGGAVVDNIFPGVNQPCGLIGIAEKGYINLKFETKTNGGHASAPGPHTPVGKLSAACYKLENHPFKSHYTLPVLEMFDRLGRHSTFVYKIIFSNLWLFSGILDGICKKSGGELNALVRTTVAFTQMEGSSAPNVIPPEATMVANMRLNPEDSVQSSIDYIRKVIKDDSIVLTPLNPDEPSPVSDIKCEGWDIVSKAVASTWKGCIVSPYLMIQCSDSRHYSPISNRVFKFSAMDLTSAERKTIHGNDEHVRLETATSAVEFFIRVMKRC